MYQHHLHAGYERRHDQFPMIQHWSDDQPFRRQRMVDACSWRCSLQIKEKSKDNSVSNLALATKILTVHLLYNVQTNGSGKDGGESERAGSL